MREILFRGKAMDYERWLYGWAEKYSFGRYPLKMSIIPCDDAEDGYYHHVMVDPETVGQFTGLTDKNGTKVFEGDIIAFTCNDGTKNFSVVKYGRFNCSCCHGVYGWYLEGDCGDIRDLDPQGEILRYISVEGNIHDNPELLEVEDGN